MRNQRIGRGMRAPKQAVILDVATGHITLDILKADVKHNGQLQALADLAEARKTGVKLTPEAEEYAREICSGTGYPMRDSDW